MKNRVITPILCVIIFTGVVFFSVKYIIPLAAFCMIAQSHIDGNVPSEKNFDAILQRDLTEYFSTDGENITVEYVLLRNKPTHAGISFPKYYAWVEVYSGGILQREGAINVSAIDKNEFGVNGFFPKETIMKDEEALAGFFPSDVCKKIKQYANGVRK